MWNIIVYIRTLDRLGSQHNWGLRWLFSWIQLNSVHCTKRCDVFRWPDDLFEWVSDWCVGAAGGCCTNHTTVLRGTIPNYIIFIGHYDFFDRGQSLQQPIKMTSYRIVPRTTDPTVSATAPRFVCLPASGADPVGRQREAAVRRPARRLPLPLATHGPVRRRHRHHLPRHPARQLSQHAHPRRWGTHCHSHPRGWGTHCHSTPIHVAEVHTVTAIHVAEVHTVTARPSTWLRYTLSQHAHPRGWGTHCHSTPNDFVAN